MQNNHSPQSLNHSSLSHCGKTKNTTADKIAFRANHDTHHSQGVNKSGNDWDDYYEKDCIQNVKILFSFLPMIEIKKKKAFCQNRKISKVIMTQYWHTEHMGISELCNMISYEN